MDSKSTWADVIDALQLPSGCSVLEVVARGDDSLARALYHRNPTAALITLDMRAADNTGRPLAALLCEQFDPGAFHLIALRHIIADIVESAVAEQEGITPDSSAGEAQPAVMRALRAYWRSGDLENTVVPRFLDIVDACRSALRPQGRILLAHQVLDSDLRLGHPLELYADYIPLARRWLAEAALPLREIPLDGFDPHWWLCLQRTSAGDPRP
ncbi:MAG: hypothetical protein OEV33_03705 [Armatimonadota bacterium]|nr:hypothetical protein [Armatimonadota bacterium]